MAAKKFFTQIFIYFSKPLRLLYSLIIYEIVNFSFFTLYSLLLLSFFLYLKSVPIYVIVHVYIYIYIYRQWNLRIKDTLGSFKVSSIKRCPLFRGKIIHQSIRMGLKQVSFIERCPLFRGSFIGGSTVHIHVYIHVYVHLLSTVI